MQEPYSIQKNGANTKVDSNGNVHWGVAGTKCKVEMEKKNIREAD